MNTNYTPSPEEEARFKEMCNGLESILRQDLEDRAALYDLYCELPDGADGKARARSLFADRGVKVADLKLAQERLRIIVATERSMT